MLQPTENILAKKIVALIIFIAIIFGGLFGSKFFQINQAMSSRKAPPPPVVSTVKVAEQSWKNNLSAVGNINPERGIILSNEIAGLVSRIHFKSGQTVSKGEVLLELNSETDQAVLNGLLAREHLASIKFNRQVKLLANKATSLSSHDEARAVLDVAKTAVLAQQSRVSKKRICAPFDGIMGIRQVSLGQYLDKGQEIAPLVSLSSTLADFSLAERYISQLHIGQTVSVQVQAYPSQTFTGKVQAINPGFDQRTRTIAVRAVIANPQHKLKPGMFADIQLTTSQPSAVLTLPETAVSYNTYGDSVFVVVNGATNTTVVQRSIKSGRRQHGHVEVLQGLTVNDSVVNEGHIKLRNGMSITIAQPTHTTTP
ncbi:MAG: efflux RND transporter periplasmic adaptor subunit, partial [Bermanella sp.]